MSAPLGNTCVLDTDCTGSYVCMNSVCSVNTTGFKANTTVYIVGAIVAGVVVIFVLSMGTWLFLRRKKQRMRMLQDQNTYRFEHASGNAPLPPIPQQQQQQWMASPQAQYNTSPAPPYTSPGTTPGGGGYGSNNPFESKPIELAAVEKPSDAHVDYFELQGDQNWSPLEEGGKRRSKLVGSKSKRKS